MDPLGQSDLHLARATPPSTRLAQAIELMEVGLRWKRAAIARAHPDASSAEIEDILLRWLLRDD